jgi:hypothetical protein
MPRATEVEAENALLGHAICNYHSISATEHDEECTSVESIDELRLSEIKCVESRV